MALGVTLALTVGLPAFSAPESESKKADSKKTESKTAEKTADKPAAWSEAEELKKREVRLRLKNLKMTSPRVEVTHPPKNEGILPKNTKSAEIKSITISRPVQHPDQEELNSRNDRLRIKKLDKKAIAPGDVLYDTRKGGRQMLIARPATQPSAQTSHKVAIKPASTAGVFSATLNKQGSQPSYKNGEKMQIAVTANQDCNLNIFNFDGHKLVQIFPNDFQKDSSVRAGETIEIGGADSEFDYQAALPRGAKKSEERIFVYAYPTNDAPVSIALNHMENAPFRDAEMSIEQYRDLINQAKAKVKDRDIAIVAKKKKSNVQLTSDSSSSPSNTIEIPFTIVER